jgi:hypothetical protein
MKAEESADRRHAYLHILKHGLLAIRESARSNNAKLCEVEAEHLHNIPSLLDETNERRHIYYAELERKSYMDHVLSHADPGYMSRTVDLYEKAWVVLMRLALQAQETINEEFERQLKSQQSGGDSSSCTST